MNKIIFKMSLHAQINKRNIVLFVTSTAGRVVCLPYLVCLDPFLGRLERLASTVIAGL